MKKLFVLLLTAVFCCFSTAVLADLDLDARLVSALKKDASVDEIQALLAKGANVNAKDASGETPLMIAAKTTSEPEVMKALFEAGVELDARNNEGFTALMLAVMRNANIGVMTLIKAGADVNATLPSGWSVLMLAAQYSPNPKVIEAMLEAGADVNMKNLWKKKALYYARKNRNLYKTDAYYLLKDKTK